MERDEGPRQQVSLSSSDSGPGFYPQTRQGRLVGGADPEQPRGLAPRPVLSEVPGGHWGKINLQVLM